MIDELPAEEIRRELNELKKEIEKYEVKAKYMKPPRRRIGTAGDMYALYDNKGRILMAGLGEQYDVKDKSEAKKLLKKLERRDNLMISVSIQEFEGE